MVLTDSISRRNFIAGAGAATALATSGKLLAAPAAPGAPFHTAVISDEISQDFDHACHVIANDFGLHYVELRDIFGKNMQSSTDAEIAEARKILAKYNLTVTDIASPLFKVDWPDAPLSPYAPKHDNHGAAAVGYAQQDEVLERCISLAKQFGTNKVRCFDFWRLEDVAPHRAAINAKLLSAANTAGKQGILLVLENEFACNTATGREASATLAGVQTPHLGLNWDPGNAVMRGELDAYPGGWDTLPKNRIHHCHVKNAVKQSEGKTVWSPVDVGIIDWAAQFRALRKTGYHQGVSLETHWRGGGTAEASTRRSWAGMNKCLEESESKQT